MTVQDSTATLLKSTSAHHSPSTYYHSMAEADTVISVRNFSLWYSKKRALTNVTIDFPRNQITALIGPSGCGKSTLLRAINRMNDLIKGVRTEGNILIDGNDIYAKGVDPVEVRRRIGMVFQKPNPFPRSIRENILFGAKINGYKGDYDQLVEECLRRAALWDEVKDDLNKSGLALSGGQQQRLCIARAIAVAPEVILMDEPCSALDPISTLRIEELMRDLAKQYTILVVTHNMQQASRVADNVAFMLSDDVTTGMLVEYGPTSEVFTNPKSKRTEDYITGRFG
ncbi:MAG: phosphate import ATP-binding protein PstB [Dehalococcoidia bacterium]|nr:MAG: phosphate import ATP-binding protein PstB [Dehalococcoidia bacterium]